MDSEQLKPIITRLEKLIDEANWGTYYIGKYYFSINTFKTKAQVGVNNVAEMEPNVQRKLQFENFAAIIHEYIHYIHEISTVIGNVGLAFDIVAKSMFSNYSDVNLRSARHEGLAKGGEQVLNEYAKIWTSINIINGSDKNSIEGIFMRVTGIEFQQEDVHIRDGSDFKTVQILIPKIHFQQAVDNKIKESDLIFGKFFLYEGLAYELDRKAEAFIHPRNTNLDYAKGTEYIVLRSLASYLYPNIDKETFLTIASLSLSHIDSGHMFINYVNRFKEERANNIEKTEILAQMKLEVSTMLFEKLEDFNGAHDEIVSVFQKRQSLHSAFTAVASAAKAAYLLKCERPAFEVELIWSNNYTKLFELLPICDYMYLFADDDKYMRDFLGTSSLSELESQALKVLIGYDHYQKAHQLQSTEKVEKKGSCACPFFTCCSLPLRQNYRAICESKPWRIFEISANGDQQYCWYGTAVGESKGHTVR